MSRILISQRTDAMAAELATEWAGMTETARTAYHRDLSACWAESAFRSMYEALAGAGPADGPAAVELALLDPAAAVATPDGAAAVRLALYVLREVSAPLWRAVLGAKMAQPAAGCAQ